MADPKIRHPELEGLLAWRDGEATSFRAWRIRRHLNRCWPCRLRISELDETIARVAADIPRLTQCTTHDIAKARWRFHQAVAHYELERTEAPRRFTALRLGGAIGAVAATAVLVFFMLPGKKLPPPPPSAAGLLEQAIRLESDVSPGTIHEERLSVEFRTSSSRPAPVLREWRAWSAPGPGLYSARWSDAEGTLRNAVFAADSRDSSVYSKETGLVRARLVRPAAYTPLYSTVSGSTDDQALEREILSWIQRQVWEPVSLGREMSEFCTRTGAVLRVTNTASGFRWTAEAVIGKALVRIVLEGRRNERPRLMDMSWNGPRNSGSLRLGRVKTFDYADMQLAAAWLRPDASLVRMPRPVDAIPSPAPIAATIEPTERELAAAEVEVLALVHGAGLCLRGDISIDSAGNSLQVRAVLVDQQHAERLTALLSTAAQKRFVHVQVTTAEPSLEHTGASVVSLSADAKPAPAEAWLRARMGVGRRNSERTMFNVMNGLIRDSEQMLSASWAVERLASRFPPARERLLDDTSRAELRHIVAAHLSALSAHASSLDAALTRLDIRTEDRPIQDSGVLDWQAGTLALHKRVRVASDLMISLFAASDGRATFSANRAEVELPTALADLRVLTAAAHDNLVAVQQYSQK